MANSQLIQIITEDDELYEFEAITSYSGNDTSTLTSYPTSEGTPRTDNIYNNPNTFNCAILIGGNTNTSDEWGIGIDRPKTANAIFEKWKTEAVKLTIITNQKDYFNMFLTKINVNSNTNNSYDYSASLEFSELLIANFTTETIGPFVNDETFANSSNAQSSTSNDNGNIFTDILEWASSGAEKGAEIGDKILPGGLGRVIGSGLGALVSAVGGCIDKLGEWTGWW